MYTVPMQASSHCRHTFREVLTDQTTLSPQDTHLFPYSTPDGSRLSPQDTHLFHLGRLTSLPQDTHLYPYSTQDAPPGHTPIPVEYLRQSIMIIFLHRRLSCTLSCHKLLVLCICYVCAYVYMLYYTQLYLNNYYILYGELYQNDVIPVCVHMYTHWYYILPSSPSSLLLPLPPC